MREQGAQSSSRLDVQNATSTPLKTTDNLKVCHGQDSDVDSGIVSCEKPGQRIGSTSSTDTNSSHGSRQKIQYCSPLPKCDLRTNGIQLRTVRRASCLAPPNGPVKADHTVLKECNRRPPTPLTVFPDPHPSVRFDEQLQLSEQSLRRSCRKLFATLYGHRFSYPSADSNSSSSPPTKRNDEPTFRSRSQTLPEPELRKHCEMLKNSQYNHTMNPKQTCSNVDKENLVAGNRKVVSWNLKHPSPNMLDQLNRSNYSQPKQVSVSPCFQRRDLIVADRIRLQNKMNHANHACSFKTSTDSGLELCRSRCTCHNAVRNSCGSSSQSSTTSSSSTNHYATCRPPPTSVEASTTENKNTLFKSNSCSTLPSLLLQMPPPVPQQVTKFQTPAPCSENANQPSLPLQKTSSCTNLLARSQVCPIPVYNDSMMHVYAEVASVVPEDTDVASKQQIPRTARSISHDGYHLYDTVKSPPASMTAPRSAAHPSTQEFIKYPPYDTPRRNSQTMMYNGFAKDFHASRGSMPSKDNEIQRPGTPSQANLMESRLVPYRNRSYREHSHNSAVATVRPTSIAAVRPHSGYTMGYLKPALKQRIKTTSQQNVTQVSTPDVSQPTAEVEYAVVDKSKKNRFTSLPTLNRFNSNGCIPGEEKEVPPVPSKKNLHKSDGTLYRSRSSSPRKSFFEKVQVLTKNARDVLQKAFSTERIYRPEREERLEATGQKLLRSKSFIKGLRSSMSRKRKKNKPPLAEVVPQASSNPVWDEQPSGPNSPVHVRGQLLQLNLDGSQVIELSKPHNKPYGFFVARGRVRNSKGVFVSRMRDQVTQKQLAGLLDIGDEILEIEGLGVKDADIMQVNDLMANKNTLLLTVLPYICRKDI